MVGKRYEASYIDSNFCDGFWDNKEIRYLDVDEVKNIIYENLENKEIESILNRNNQIKEENKNMNSDKKLIIKGLGILLLGIFSVIWTIVVFISSIVISTLISVKLGLTGYYWWFGSIIIFCLLNKIIYFNNDGLSNYSELVERYKNESKNIEE